MHDDESASTTAGPTTRAERTGDPTRAWTSHPKLAAVLRVVIVLAPLALSTGFSWWVGRAYPPDRLGINRWVWFIGLLASATVIVVGFQRVFRRALPLVALMKLTLVFPDQAPSRMRAALRTSGGRALVRQLQEGKVAIGEVDGAMLAQMIASISEHDRLTRGHSERVRAYAEIIGTEIGLPEKEMNLLRWGSLLHDVGKLTVPAEILNSATKPTDEEWRILQGHPAAGGAILEPLRGWLGDWVHAADQHHLRWDGKGYPQNLAGHQISLPGRIVAVADAYDVMTSARSYKKPMSHELARQELTDCAGTHFDPVVVRAFLEAGLGRMRAAVGPFTWIANTLGSGQISLPAAGPALTAASGLAGGVAAAGMSLVGLAPTSEPPDSLAFVDPTPVVRNVELTATEDTPITVTLEATGGSGSGTITAGTPSNGETRLSPSIPLPESDGRWIVTLVYTPAADFDGTDRFEYEACDDTAQCATANVTIDVMGVNDPPTATPDVAEVIAGETVLVDVVVNDDDPDGDQLAVAVTSPPANGTATVLGRKISYRAEAGYEGEDVLWYSVTDAAGLRATATVTLSVRPEPVETTTTTTAAPTTTVAPLPAPRAIPAAPVPVRNQPPVAVFDVAAGFTTLEDVAFTTADVTANDSDADDPVERSSVRVFTTPTKGSVVHHGDGTFTYTPFPNANGYDSFTYTLTDPSGATSDPATVTIAIVPVVEPPDAVDDAGTGYVTAEDTAFTTADVTANDTDPDDPVDRSTVALATPASRGFVASNGDGTFTYTPGPNFFGVDSFTYTLTDPGGATSDPATVTITVTALNDPPVAVGDSLTVFEGLSATTVDLRLNDLDVDGDTLTITAVVDGADGTTVDNGDGTVTYTHDGSSTAGDAFVYTVSDPAGLTSNGIVLVRVIPLEDFDGVPGPADNCPLSFNITQLDSDGDGIGDRCDPSPTDASTATFTMTGQALGPDKGRDVAMGDLDGDGDLDLVFATDREPGLVWFNNGTGTFVDSGQTLGLPTSMGVELGDLDGDGDLDIVQANRSGWPNLIWINDGTGAFTDSGVRIWSGNSNDVALGDVDGDGDLDLAFANDGWNDLWFNNGSGSFAFSGQWLGPYKSTAIAFADLDGDLDLDAVVANDGDANLAFINLGGGLFASTLQPIGIVNSHALALADFDGDGDVDLAIAAKGDGDSIWLNDGTGRFTRVGPLLGLGDSVAVSAGDLDGDGDIDLVFGDDGDADSIWWNDGSATFTDSGQRLGTSKTWGVDLGDVDGDGDLDLVTAEDDDPNRVWLND